MNRADAKPADLAAEQRSLVQALRDPACYPHPVASVALIETHISYVLLTGRYAYKIKKAVDFGFLDFSTLDLRRRFSFVWHRGKYHSAAMRRFLQDCRAFTAGAQRSDQIPLPPVA